MDNIKAAGCKWMMLPFYGILIFTLLYFTASLYYPGGNQVDDMSPGFSWINNYWCDLLGLQAYNEEPNLGRPIAIAAMLIICISLASFWYLIPNFIRYSKIEAMIIRFSGIAAMFVALFLSSKYHDIVIYASTGFGLIALIGTFLGLIRLKWNFLFYFGVFNLFVIALDHYLYYTKEYLIYLPVVQKVNFAFLLIWFAWISIKLSRKFPDDQL